MIHATANDKPRTFYGRLIGAIIAWMVLPFVLGILFRIAAVSFNAGWALIP